MNYSIIHLRRPIPDIRHSSCNCDICRGESLAAKDLGLFSQAISDRVGTNSDLFIGTANQGATPQTNAETHLSSGGVTSRSPRDVWHCKVEHDTAQLVVTSRGSRKAAGPRRWCHSRF